MSQMRRKMATTTTTVQYPPGYLEGNQQPTLYAVSVLFIILNTIAVALHFASRRISAVKWHSGNTLVLVSWIFSMGFLATVLGDIRFGGIGLHQARVMMMDPNMLESWAKYILPVSYTYIMAASLPKLAVLSLYLSIFGTTVRVVRVICYVTGLLIVANILGSCAAGFAICVPLNYLWNKNVQGGGHCLDQNAMLRLPRIANIASDVVMLVLPVPYIAKLQMSCRLKLGLLITFSIGSLGLVAGAVTLSEVSKTDMLNDCTWSGARIILWSIIESGTYLLTACLLTCQPLVKFLWHKMLTLACFKRPEGAGKQSNNNNNNNNNSQSGSDCLARRSVSDDHGHESCGTLELAHRYWSSRTMGSGGIVVERQFLVE